MKFFLALISVVLITCATTCSHINASKAVDIENEAISLVHTETSLARPVVNATPLDRNLSLGDLTSEAEQILTEATSEVVSLNEKTRTFGIAGLVGGLFTLLSTWISGIVTYFKRRKEPPEDER